MLKIYKYLANVLEGYIFPFDPVKLSEALKIAKQFSKQVKAKYLPVGGKKELMFQSNVINN